MKGVAALEKKSRWLTGLSTVAVFAGLAIAVVYAVAALSFPPGTRLVFGILVVVISVGFNVAGDALEQRRLKTLRGLGDGTIAPRPQALAEAAREAARSPDVSFGLVLGLVGGGAVLVAVTWPLFCDVPRATVLRVGFIGVAVAPLTAVMANLIAWPRVRVVLRALVEAGLPVDAAYAAVPARFELKPRLVLFAGVATLTPLLLVADMAVTRLSKLAEPGGGGAMWPVLVLGGLVLVMVAACASLVGSVLGAPLAELAKETERLARGEYGQPRLVPGEFETWAAAGGIALLEVELANTTRRVAEATSSIVTSTTDLSSGRSEHLSAAEEQSAALAATTATTEELARSARQIALNAQRVSELARGTLDAARAGKSSADAFTGAMQQVREGNQAIADSVVRLNKRVQQVGRIIEFINGIADKSDLLALNAELEGNKAGEVGRGFSLVAAEMRRLAESVMHSTAEIARLIEEIRDATNAAVMATEAGVKATDAGAALAQRVSEGLARIVEFANLSSDAMQSISLATGQQQAGTDQLVASMADILNSTRAAADASRAMESTHAELLVVTKELDGAVRQEVKP
ncbi:MAG: methyl-accepting chemotaxis protein [Myxococcota bacterium]